MLEKPLHKPKLMVAPDGQVFRETLSTTLFNLGISCTVFVLICTVVVLYCFVMCVCVFCNVCACVGVLVIYILYSD
jgi:hypothetical protein